MTPPPTFNLKWGPPAVAPDSLWSCNVPYAPFSKNDKLGKVADWNQDPLKEKETKRVQHGRGFRNPYHAYGASSSSFFTADTPDSALNFRVVDKQAPKAVKQTSAVLKRRGNAGMSRFNHQNQDNAPNNSSKFRRNTWQTEKKHREPSVTISPDWKLVQTNNFLELQKLSYSVDKPEVLTRAGTVHLFDKGAEQLKEPRHLTSATGGVYSISTSEDPIIEQLAEQHKGKVYATDRIIALLMCAARTNLPWDIIITKKNGDVYFDKRDNGPLDFLSVDENSSNPPSDTADLPVNTPRSLSLEATYLNTNYCSSVITSQATKFEKSNPFGDDEEVLPKGYIYSRFNLESDSSKEPINLVMRSEVDAVAEDGSYTLCRALNEYRAPLDWKDGWANRRGALIGSEMRNNLSKLCQWTAQAYLAGAKQMKLGFVSRISARDHSQHELIGVQNTQVANFAKELHLEFENGWGIVRSIVDIFLKSSDGRYVLLRDPNAPALKIYKLPPNAVVS